MSRIPLTSGFSLIQEGEYIFRIYEATYDEDFGKIIVKMVTADGQTHNERFSIKNKDDEYNEGALNAFSYFARTALQDFESEDIEISDLVDHYIKAEVVHTKQPRRDNPDKTVTFANLGNKSKADGFDTEPVTKALTLGKKEQKPVNDIDLDSLLD